MTKKYYRPIIKNSSKGSVGSHKLAGGWSFLEDVEVIPRNGKCKLIKAEDLPKKTLHNLTIKRQNLFNLSFSSPHIMGILNVTPDSFSDGGKYNELDSAFEEFIKMMNFGASIIDIGGESTRPGAEPITVNEEISRISPILEKIRSSGIDLPISVDTRKSEVWDIAKQLGANMLNDISSLTYDKEMRKLVIPQNVPICVMHSKGVPKSMKSEAVYDNVLLDVYDFLENVVENCVQIGIPRKNIIVDPGIGFAKTLEHNLTLIRGLSIFHSLGCPILLGASRKRFIKTIGLQDDPLKISAGSIAVALEAITQGVQLLRVHDVFETMQALRLWKSINMGIN